MDLVAEVDKRVGNKLLELKSYENKGEEPLYLTDDIMLLLGLKSIWTKVNQLIDNQDKFNRTIKINDVTKYRTLITKKGVRRIISSMRTKPHELICKFFDYKEFNQIEIPDGSDLTKFHDDWISSNSFEAGPNNIYIRRLKNIFASQKIETFLKVDISHNCSATLDVFFPKFGIVILFNKKANLFDSNNALPYLAAQQEILKKNIYLTNLTWIQFKDYDTNQTSQFDELLKDIVKNMIK